MHAEREGKRYLGLDRESGCQKSFGPLHRGRSVKNPVDPRRFRESYRGDGTLKSRRVLLRDFCLCYHRHNRRPYANTR